MKNTNRATLIELDGLASRDAGRIPRPVDMANWTDEGLYTLDVDLGVFRLTNKGRAFSKGEASA